MVGERERGGVVELGPEAASVSSDLVPRRRADYVLGSTRFTQGCSERTPAAAGQTRSPDNHERGFHRRRPAGLRLGTGLHCSR